MKTTHRGLMTMRTTVIVTLPVAVEAIMTQAAMRARWCASGKTIREVPKSRSLSRARKVVGNS